LFFFFQSIYLIRRISVVLARYPQRDLWVKDGACYRHTSTTDRTSDYGTRGFFCGPTVATRCSQADRESLNDHSVVWDWEPRCVNLSCCFDDYSMKSEWTQLVVSQFHRRTITTDGITPLDKSSARTILINVIRICVINNNNAIDCSIMYECTVIYCNVIVNYKPAIITILCTYAICDDNIDTIVHV